MQKAIGEFPGKTIRCRSKPHDVRVQSAGGELAVSFHCTLDPATAITDAHDLTVRLEEYLRATCPDSAAS